MAALLQSRLPADRTRAGTLWMEEDGTVVWGPVPCLAQADNAGATAHKNPSRDPLRPYGDHPLGRYRITAWVPTGTDPKEVREYCPHGKLVLDPIAGPALEAKQNGRYALLLHGGAVGGPYEHGFRPTFGCLRMRDLDMVTLVLNYRTLKCEEYEATEG